MHERLAGAQSSRAVRAAWELNQVERPSRGGSISLMRAAVVEKVAETLRDFLVR